MVFLVQYFKRRRKMCAYSDGDDVFRVLSTQGQDQPSLNKYPSSVYQVV